MCKIPKIKNSWIDVKTYRIDYFDVSNGLNLTIG